MGSSEMEYFADSVPNDNTYMSQICSKIFTFSNSTLTSPELSAVVDSTCQDWFLQALEHCTETIFVPTETSFHSWLFHKILILGFSIFPKRPDTSLSNPHPHVEINPRMLKKTECNQLFLEIARDYIDIAPKYSTCMEEGFFLLSIFKGLVGLFILLVIFMYVRKFALSRKTWMEKHTISEDTKINDEAKKTLEMLRLISGYSLRTQRIDKKYLRVIPDIYDSPTIAINVKRKRLSDALCCLIKSEPMIEKMSNGMLVKPFKKDRRYALHKINGFLNKTSKCRVIIEMDLVSDSEDEDYFHDMQHTLSGGDFIPKAYENATEESVETSSACSGLYSPKERHYKQERSYSSRNRYVHSSGYGIKVPINSVNKRVSTHSACLNRNESSNSVAIVPKKSTTSFRRNNSDNSVGKCRSVKISKF